MQAVPGTLQTGGVPFGTTHWSVVAACTKADESGEAHAALAQLCRDYWPPLYSFVRRRGYHSDDAQDLVQGFFAHFLGNQAYAQTDRRKGKFRTFLLASLKHYMADVWNRERALKRGGDREFVVLDEEISQAEKLWADESSNALNEEQHYERRWAVALVNRALQRLSADSGSKARIFTELRPFLSGGVGLPSQEEVARRLEMPIETLRSHLSRLRTHYREILREEVARTVSQNDSVDDELRHLCGILTAAC
ncbi:MAG: RNA polymerase sigma factor [Verrucomicrobiota bacterium]|nr:RNA polymerase sigma factor [Verrucomicrobiota bacterium]